MPRDIIDLDERYTRDDGAIVLTGTQAIGRLLFVQARRDRAAGLRTAGFVSGYRGSPLGGVDQTLWRASGHLAAHDITLQPAVNEELAATMIWGTQQIGLWPGATRDGVFGLWYGKGPGVDRSGDAFRHANLAGTAPHGGVLALAGDDPLAKSSTVAYQSEPALISAGMPVLNPADLADFLRLGGLAWAMSRFSGCWVSMKAVTDLVDSSRTLGLGPGPGHPPVLPTEVELPPDGVHLRWPDPPVLQERRLVEVKLPLARAFARANGFDGRTHGRRGARIGIVATGKAWIELVEALALLGLDAAAVERLGLTVYKVGLVWPLEPAGLLDFAHGLEEMLVLEEKRDLVEQQARHALYHAPADARPRILGKTDEDGRPLVPAWGEISAEAVAALVGRRLVDRHGVTRLAPRTAEIEQRLAAAREAPPPAAARVPYFCSGCPHNTSTRVPEGSRALAGIGCHTLALYMERSTETWAPMGHEGALWLGQMRYTETPHVFVNMGDGTYFHSGLLAIRAAVAAGATLTYKLLYNDAVAMTGGQPVDGQLTVPAMAAQVAAEGARRVVVVTDEPERYGPMARLPQGAVVEHRDALDRIQRELRDTPGVTVLIYDQTCATEKRRRRKRSLMEDPARRVVINEAVCEGCGDCQIRSNCLSVVPIETEYGTKRQIDQSSCNKDFSCLAGFCPSFVTVEGGRPKAPARPSFAAVEAALPEPVRPILDRPYGVLVAGVGGTGVVTIGTILAIAAHLDGLDAAVLDQTGLAQKGGSVVSHIRLGPAPGSVASPRIPAGEADLVLACDMVTAAAPDPRSRIAAGRTHIVVNAYASITGEQARHPGRRLPSETVLSALRRAAGDEAVTLVDATRLANALIGDSIGGNLLLVGHAWQQGLVPLGAEAIEAAIRSLGVAVDQNLRAFALGRRLAHDPAAVGRLAARAEEEAGTAGDDRMLSATPEEAIARRAAALARYQDEAYAERFRAFVARVRAAEVAVTESTALTLAVARSLYRLMAYKDEYEVARLYTETGFLEGLRARFEGGPRIRVHLAPPLLAGRDPETGRPRKRAYGPWMLRAFRVLARLRRLRGTPFDPFGRTAERRLERRLIEEYRATVEALLAGLDAGRHALAVEIARLPEEIRGFGHVKQAALEQVRAREAALLERYRTPAPGAPAAEAAE